MNSAIWVMVASLIIIFCLTISNSSRKSSNSFEQWAIGDRSFGTLLVFILMGGEIYTTFTFLGGSSFAYSKGGLCYYILCYSPIAYTLGYWMTPRIWQYAKQHKLVSQADFFATKYQSKTLGVLISAVGLIALIPYLLLQIKGLGIIVNATSYGKISITLASWISCIMMTIYVVFSGILGTARLAVIKDILILLVVIFIGIYLPYHYYGGFHAVFAQVEMIKPEFTIITGLKNKIWFISTTLLCALGLYMWPHSFSSVYTAGNAKILRKNAIFLPLYQVILLFVLIIGFVAVLQTPGLDKSMSDKVLLNLAIHSFDPWFIGIVGTAGFLTALVPGSVILLSAATLLVRNIYYVVVAPSKPFNPRNVKLAVLLIMAVVLCINSFASESIVGLLIIAYGLVTQLFPAFIFSLFLPDWVNKYGAISGILLGMIIMFASLLTPHVLNEVLPAGIRMVNIGLVALLANFGVMLLISKLSSKTLIKFNFYK